MTEHEEPPAPDHFAEIAEGRPNEVEAVAVVWERLSQVTGVVADDLRRGLDTIEHEWNLPDGLRDSLFRIEALCQMIAEGAARAQQALHMMAEQLDKTQRMAEKPDDPDPGAAQFGRAGVIDLSFGYVQDEQARAEALERLAGLAAELDVWYEQRAAGIQAPWRPNHGPVANE
jgi:hypothetical protein